MMTVSRTICLGFLVVILVGTFLLMLPISTSNGAWNDLIIALFTSTSAVCVTGHIVVDTATHFSPWGHFFILALIQVGGLGYMVVSTFLLLLLGRRIGLQDKLALQEALDRPKLQGGAQVVRSIIATVLLFEITGVFLLMGVFLPDHGFSKGLWYAIFHSVSAWNNAGFSLFSDNLVSYKSSLLLNLTIPGLIIFGGIGYETLFETYLWLRDRLLRQPARIVFSLHFRVAISTTLVLLSLGTLMIFWTEYGNMQTIGSLGAADKILASWFQSVTSRTAGFNTIDIGKMTTASLFITIALMFVGASPGGTGGGIKTTTLRVLSSCTKSILQGKETVSMYERQIPFSLVLKSIGVVFGSMALVAISTIWVSLSNPELDFIQILFEVVSAFGTVGLSTGITAQLTASSKLMIIATMYIGRVGVLVLMAALLGDPRPQVIRYPEESLLVG